LKLTYQKRKATKEQKLSGSTAKLTSANDKKKGVQGGDIPAYSWGNPEQIAAQELFCWETRQRK